ncbi:putative vegetative incompatibility protein HET-E-1 [Rhizoctonia solani 123E]|uniref:Putative vegetative incompatibility protein HET-E-1 n=1 Tax=Rhizoctonia solani 123E TaxID=1423351 RepID=A0A074SH18_9AGAM|nr:putative vegetative incompatibility protein HET-E-1 [Rhizoctonia solani 123E]
MRGRSHVQTYIRAEEDVQDIMEYYRRIHSIFQKLQRIVLRECTLPQCRDVGRIIPTIAYQLAQVSPEFALELSRVLELNADSQLQGLETQFQKLLISPLQSASKGLSLDLVVVIEALDECEDQEGAGLLINLLLAQPNLPIKFLITSRPEPVIRASLENSSAHFEVCHLHSLDETTVKGDIRAYLEDELRHMPTPLTNVQLDSLVERSNTLFIFAATAVRYIRSRNFSMNPEKRLALVLGASNTTSEVKDAEICELYMTIVDSAFTDTALEDWDREDRKRVLHAVICAQQPLTILALADLLEMTPKRVDDALDALWSVLSVPLPGSDGGFVTVLHTSFRDFIFSCPDSKTFYCDQKQHNQKLAHRCLEMIRHTKPSFNICALESSYILDDEDSRLPERIKAAISPGLLYSCLNWIAHLEIAGGPEDWDQFSEFFTSSLLLWMEILTLTRCIGLGPRVMWRAQQLSKDYNSGGTLHDLVQDAHNFVTMFASSPARLSTPHIYISMLALWPRDSPIYGSYSQRFCGLIATRGSTIASHQSRILSKWLVGDAVSSLAISPDGARVTTGTSNGNICIWDTQSKQIILGPLKIHLDAVTLVAYTPNGLYVAPCPSSAMVFIQNSQTGQIALGPLKAHSKRINSIVYSPDSTLLITGSDDCTIRAWSTSTGETVAIFEGHTAPVLSVTCSRSENRTLVVSGSADRQVFILEIRTAVIRVVFGPLDGHNSPVTAVACSPDGSCAVSGSADGTICIWDTHTGRMLRRCPTSHLSSISRLSFSPSGSQFASCSIDSTIYTWDLFSTEPVVGRPLGTQTCALSALSYSPYGDQIISCSEDGVVHVFGTTRAGSDIAGMADGHLAQINSVAYSPDGAHIASGSHDKTVCTWDAYTGCRSLGPLEQHSGTVEVVAYSSDSSLIVSGSADKTLIIWVSQTGKIKIGPLRGHESIVYSAAFFPDNMRVVSGSADHAVHIWSVSTGELIAKVRDQESWVYSVACSPSGSHFASGSVNQTIRVYEVSEDFDASSEYASQPLVLKSDAHASPVLCCAFSPDGAYIVSGSDDGAICRWDVNTGELTIWPVGEPDSIVRTVAYSPDGKYVASGSEDGVICIVDARTGDTVAGPLQAHSDEILSIAYSPDNTHLASGSADGTIRVWSIDRLQRRLEPQLGTAQRLTKDGWVIDHSLNRLVWIPHDLQDRLSLEGEVFQIASQGSFSLDMASCNRHQAHENPTIVWSIAIGAAGPLAVAVVPPIRRRFGWAPDERIPTSYPLPNRARATLTGYDDPA